MSHDEWRDVDGRKYAKDVICSEMEWGGMDLARFHVAGAPFGGPVALIPNLRQIHQLGYNSRELTSPELRIFTSWGVEISAIPWTHRNLFKMGWTDSESLACVLEDGTVHLYDIHGEMIANFSMGYEAKEKNVGECCLWGSGLVIRLAASSTLFYVSDFDDPRPRRLAESGLDVPSCMAIIQPEFTQSGHLEVLLGTSMGSIVVVDDRRAEDQQLRTGQDPFVRMVVSASGKLVACFNSKGNLFVFTTDFTKNVSMFATKSKVEPLDIAWCGDEAVVLYWKDIVLMVGLQGEFIKYPYDGPIAMVPECDGIRIVADTCCDLLRPVPDSTVDVFRVGSQEPAALLYDAYELYEEGDAGADEIIRSIGDEEDLQHAIEDCLDAAAHSFDKNTQRKLLKAASYGALFSNSDGRLGRHFVDTCKLIRVINAVRTQEIGIAITYEQFLHLEVEVLVDRLINRYHHLLAMRLCEYMGLPPEKVLIHWACTKIRLADEDDRALGDIIIGKLDAYPDISYSEIANAAFQAGRRALATMLLECEPRAADQVPLLISMREDEIALDKAIDSCDTDLVYLALLHIKRTRSVEELFSIVNQPHRRLARDLFVAYCRKHDKELLANFFITFRSYPDVAHEAMHDAYEATNWVDRMNFLDVVADCYNKAKDTFMLDMIKQQKMLLSMQRQNELDIDEPIFVDTSVSRMIETYIEHAQVNKALAMKDKFRVPEERFWHIHVRSLAKVGAWEELERLTKKTPPIGFDPFIEACLARNARHQALKYIQRLSDHHSQIEWLCNIGSWKEAVEVAAKHRDRDALLNIRNHCRDDQVLMMINKLLSGPA